MFPRGVSEYVDRMEDLIPGMKDGTVQTALDTGCGVHNILSCLSSYILVEIEHN